MKINIMNFKFLNKSILLSIALLGLYQNTTLCEAVSVTPIYLGQDSAFTDKDIPPAIKLNESTDGLAAGTYLYRTLHQNVAYYSPVTPTRYRDTIYEPAVNVQYRNWGPWKMAKNQIDFTVKSGKKYYNEVTILAGKTVQGPSPSSADVGVSIGSFSKNTKVYVRAHSVLTSGTWIYFSLVGTELEGANTQNIGRVALSSISTNETPTNVFRSGSSTARISVI